MNEFLVHFLLDTVLVVAAISYGKHLGRNEQRAADPATILYKTAAQRALLALAHRRAGQIADADEEEATAWRCMNGAEHT